MRDQTSESGLVSVLDLKQFKSLARTGLKWPLPGECIIQRVVHVYHVNMFFILILPCRHVLHLDAERNQFWVMSQSYCVNAGQGILMLQPFHEHLFPPRFSCILEILSSMDSCFGVYLLMLYWGDNCYIVKSFNFLKWWFLNTDI